MYITLHDLLIHITYFKTPSRYFLRKSNLTNSETLDNQYHKQFEDALSM